MSNYMKKWNWDRYKSLIQLSIAVRISQFSIPVLKMLNRMNLLIFFTFITIVMEIDGQFINSKYLEWIDHGDQ